MFYYYLVLAIFVVQVFYCHNSDVKLNTLIVGECLYTTKKPSLISLFYQTYDLFIEDFRSFNEISFNCWNKSKIKFVTANILPTRNLILDSTFKYDLPVDQMEEKSMSFNFFKIQGFDLESSVLDHLEDVSLESSFYMTNFQFYLKGTLFDSSLCSLNYSNKISSPFQNVKRLNFGTTNKFSVDICPFIFKNINFAYLNFNGLSNVFIKKFAFI